MTSRRCTDACKYIPLAQAQGIRPPPWTDDDAGLQYHWCPKCGSVTIQRFDSNSGYGQLWMLDPKSLVLFRFAVTPKRLFDYVFSEDFFTNASITEVLYRGHIAELSDLSACANLLIPELQEHDEPEYLQMLLRLLNITLEETINRVRDLKDIRLSFGTLMPLLTVAKGFLRVMHYDPQACAEVRVLAIEVMETLARPELVEFLRPEESKIVEDMVDHGSLLERSRQDTIAARKRIHSDGTAILEMEATYLLEVFERRGAFLTETHASLLWGCMRDLSARLKTARSAKEAVRRAYRQIQKLLEHQLLSRGLRRVNAPHGKDSGLMDEQTGLLITLKQNYPEIVIFRGTEHGQPLATFDAWHDVLVYIDKARKL